MIPIKGKRRAAAHVIAGRKAIQIAGAKILLRALATPAVHLSALRKLQDDIAANLGSRVSAQGRAAAGIISPSRKRRLTKIR